MKKILLSTLLLTSFLHSQIDDFSIIIDKKFNDVLYDVTQDYDRQISAIGFSSSFNTLNSYQDSYDNGFDYLENYSRSNGANIHIVRVNKYGNVTLSKKTMTLQLSKAVSIKKTPQNGYLIGGYTLDGKLLLQKTDSNGNSIYTKIFGTDNKNLMSRIVSLEDGGALAIGSSVATRNKIENIFESGLDKSDMFVTRFSKNGTILWSRKYGTVDDDIGIDAVEAYDGSYILVSSSSNEKATEVTLMRITQNGDKLWSKSIKANTQIKAHKLLSLRDKHFVLSLSQKDDMQKEQIRLIKFDLHKNFVLDKQISTTYSSVLKDIKEFSNGTIIGVGYVKDAFDTDALAMILDSKFVLLNQEHYGGDNYDIFNGVNIMANSNVSAVGINTSSGSQESNMWIVKLKNDATMAQFSKSNRGLNNEFRELFSNEIAIENLSVSNDLSIVLNSLYFKQGKYILTKKQKMFLDTFSEKLIRFIYKYKGRIKSLEINGHTSSEWSGVDFTNNYLKNNKLSMNRAYSVLSYIFKKQDIETKKYLASIIKGSGLASSQKIFNNNVEDKDKSRKISFKIILKEEQERFYH